MLNISRALIFSDPLLHGQGVPDYSLAITCTVFQVLVQQIVFVYPFIFTTSPISPIGEVYRTHLNDMLRAAGGI